MQVNPPRPVHDDPGAVRPVAYDALPEFVYFFDVDVGDWVLVSTRTLRGICLAVPEDWRHPVRYGLTEGIRRNPSLAEAVAGLEPEAAS